MASYVQPSASPQQDTLLTASASGSPSPSSPGYRSNLEIVRMQTTRQEQVERKLDDLQGFRTGSDAVDYTEMMSHSRPGSRAHSLSPSASTSFVSPVAGVTIEHRMIAELRNQLENQASENKKLRHQIEASTAMQTYSLTVPDTANTPLTNLGTVHRSYSDNHVTQLPMVSETVESILARGRSRSPVQIVSETVQSILAARGSSWSPTQNVLPNRESATEVLLRKQLSDGQAEITLIKEKLRQNETSMDQQKAQFRCAVEELQTRLNDTIVGRDSVLALRKRESEGQEKMIAKLQQTLRDLDTANRQHEKNHLEASQRINSLQHAASSSTKALQQIYSLLLSATGRQDNHHQPSILITSPSLGSPAPMSSIPFQSPGSYPPSSNPQEGSQHSPNPQGLEGMLPLSFSLPSSSPFGGSGRALPPSHVVRLVEETLGGCRGRVRELESALKQTKKVLFDAKEEADEKVKTLTAESREKLLHLSEEQAKQLEALTERATNARQQAASLQTQLSDLQDRSEKQTSLQSTEMSALRTQYDTLKEDTQAERLEAKQKIDELTDELDTFRSNISTAREEIASLQLKLEDANLTIQNSKECLSLLQTQLEEEQERNGEQRSQEGQRLANIQTELEARSMEVRHLEELLASQKEQATAQLQQMLFEVQCEEQKKAVDKTSQLLAQIELLTAEKNQLSLDLQRKSAELDQSNQSRDRLSSVLEETSTKLESVQGDAENQRKQLEEKAKLLEVVTQERDHYQGMFEERAGELDSANSLRERLKAQVAERERQLEEVLGEKVNLAEAVETKERNNMDTLHEKDHLLKLLDDKTKEAEEVKGQRDDLVRKLKVREKRLQSLEEDVKMMTGAVADKTVEVENVIEGKAGLLVDIRTYQEKITELEKERELLETKLGEMKESGDKRSGQQQLRIQALEHDLRLTLAALRATKSTDARAVDVADGLHHAMIAKRSQVDSLQSTIHSLEETLNTAHKEKQELVGEKDHLEEKVSRLKGLVESLQHKLQSMDKKRSSQRDIVVKLETALEKAALKHTDAQQVIEQQEQTIAQMSLKHQLELKRTLAARSANPKSASNLHLPRAREQKLALLENIQQRSKPSSTALSNIKPTTAAGQEKGVTSGVVSAHFLQSASLQAMGGVAGRNYTSPLPLVILNTSGRQVDSLIDKQHPAEQETDQNISLELRDLLEEVKTVFSANVEAMKTVNSGQTTTDSADISALEDKGHSLIRITQDSLPATTRDSPSEPVLDRHFAKPEDVMDPPLRTSSPYKPGDHQPCQPKSPPSQPKSSSILNRDLDLNGPPSPVTNLLRLHTGVRNDSTLLRKDGWRSGASVNTAKAVQRTGRSTKYSANTATKVSVKRTVATNSARSYSANSHAGHVHVSNSVNATTAERMVKVNATRTETGVDGNCVNAALHGPTQVHNKGTDQATRQSSVKFADSKDTAAQNNAEGDIHLQQRLHVQVASDSERLRNVKDFDHPRKAKSRSVESMNQWNSAERDQGVGETETELIISDSDVDDASSVTTVTSVSSSITSDTGKPSSNLLGLRDRLATLSQMGNQLQKGNKEMAALIKKQDTKLKHCRQDERQAKRIINSK